MNCSRFSIWRDHWRLLRRLGCLLLFLVSVQVQAESQDALPTESRPDPAHQRFRPNVLFIAVDDLNDWISLLDKDAPIRTPHLERLAQRGVSFTRAYCASPACNPSRVAVLTGLRPSTTGVYGNKSDWKSAMPDVVTLPRYFRNNGYVVEGAGKLFHHHYGSAFHDEEAFDSFLKMPDPPDRPMPKRKLNGLPSYGSSNTDWGPWPKEETHHVDVRTVDFAIDRMEEYSQTPNQPFFLAVGIFRPHMPFFVPVRYFDSYPIDEVVMPLVRDDDRSDFPRAAHELLKSKNWFFQGMMKAESADPGTWKSAVQAYQACASFADTQVGRLLDALSENGLSNSTIIVLWSDHGYHLGEKHHWEKFALWEKSTHVPFIVACPGMSGNGNSCHQPVDLMAIYPTLVELCGLANKPGLDGISLVPLLKGPDASWDRPAVMTYGRGNHAVRSERWRYIQYSNGDEELYDHRVDPHEWKNVANDASLRRVKDSLSPWIPRENAAQVRDLKRPRK